MSWQIAEVVIYNKQHEHPRIIPFNPGSVNIITGKSHTGKTALLDIINYCLGSDICTVSQGVIRENSDWFALKIRTTNSEVFIARESPIDQRSSTKCMRLEGDKIKVPLFSGLRQTTNISEQQNFLSRLTGILPNASNVDESSTRDRLQATIRHCISFILQPQYVIASPVTLFSNVEDAFKQRALIDVFPYFLGALQQNQLSLEVELENAKRESKRLERKLSEAKRISTLGYEKAEALLSEAKAVGFSVESQAEPTVKDLHQALRAIVEHPFPRLLFEDPETLDALQVEQDELRGRALQLSRQIRAAEDFERASSAYESETKKQLDRLQPISIFKHLQGLQRCPLCDRDLDNPNLPIQELTKIYSELQANMDSVNADNPHLVEHINKLKSEKNVIRERISQLQTSIDQLLTQREYNKQLRQQNERKARVIGRISLYLESNAMIDETSPLREQVRKAKKKVADIEASLSKSLIKDKLQAATDQISHIMTSLAGDIDLEFQGVPLRLDTKALTIKVQRPGRPITLAETGSGANWVGYHLITLLALHKFFLKENMPVPSFLIFDQPSQAYFPPDLEDKEKGDINKMKSIRNMSEDKLAVRAMYDLIFRVVSELKGKLQVIITDHADLKDHTAFQESIVEIWRDGNALIPQDWLRPQE